MSIAEDLNINKVLEHAVKQNKQVMFFFHIPRCPYCERMLKENFKDKKTLDQIEKYFILVDVYSADKGTVVYNEFSGSRKEFSKYLGASAVPATFFMNIKGKVIHKAIGYRNTSELLAEIKYIGTKSYLKQDLDTFASELEFNEE